MDKKIKCGLVLIESVILLCILLVMGGSTLPIFQQYEKLNIQPYDMVYQYGNEIDLSDSFYIVDGVLTYKKGHGFKAEMLMQKPTQYSGVSPLGITDPLDKNEILITDNILDSIGKSVGDVIELYNPIYDLYVEYKIAGKLDTVFGLYENAVNSDFGVVVLGYDDTIPEMTRLKSVVFASDEMKASETGMSLDWSFDKSEMMNNILREFMIKVSIIFATVVLLLVLFVVAYIVFSYSRLAKMYRMGSSQQIISKYIRNNYLIPNMLSVLLSIALWEVINRILTGQIFVGIFLLVIPCVVALGVGQVIIKSFVRRRN